jgi:heme/copper-type cytochrome/quinol oxidase subunit 4
VPLTLLSVALAVVLLPSVLNGRLSRTTKTKTVAALLAIHAAPQFLHFVQNSSLALAIMKSATLSVLVLVLSVWMAKVYEANGKARR